MRMLTITSAAILSLCAAGGAFAQTASSPNSAGSQAEPPSKVWVYGQHGWQERNVSEPMKTRMRGERVAKPMIYWRSGGSWYAMPDNGISDELSRETPAAGGGTTR